MKSEKMYDSFNYIDDWYLDIADAPVKETKEMKHYTFRRVITVAIAAALCISLLAVTAMAAGWIPKIFAAVKPAFPEDAKILEAAIEATLEQNVETVSVPEIDYTQFTIYERYYDGESILLGYDLTKMMPETVVGYQPDAQMLDNIKQIPCWKQAAHPEQKTDDLETLYAQGYITEEVYQGTLEMRTEYAKQYGLDKYWQINMDCEMKQTLSEEQYERFWDILLETGSCCVAFPSEPWIGDHIFVNGTDCGEVLGPDCGNFRSDYTTDMGDCILLNPLPEVSVDQDSVDIEISLRSGWYYWYMELDGDVYEYFENNPPYPVVLTLKIVNN